MEFSADAYRGRITITTGTSADGQRWVNLSNGDEWYSDDEWRSEYPEQVAAFRALALAMGEAADFLERRGGWLFYEHGEDAPITTTHKSGVRKESIMKDHTDLIVSLGQGNPGAIVVLCEYREAYGTENLGKLCERFAALDWRGPKIWVLFKDLCRSDLTMFHDLFSVASMFSDEAVSKGMEILSREGLG